MTNLTNTCATEGCDQIRKPAPKNPQFKQSKYCFTHAAEARSRFISMIQANKSASGDSSMTSRERDQKFESVWQEAEAAGLAAVQVAKVVPMVVSQHSNMMDDNSPVDKQWFVGDGVCGFASVYVRPATSSFAKWVKKNKGGRSRYYGGMEIRYVSEFNQSLQRKEAFASAFARVISERLGVDAMVDSRMD